MKRSMSHVERVPRERAMHDIHVREPVSTTTHGAWGSGDPALYISRGETRRTFHLTDDVTRIGTGADCVLRLADTDRLHARVDHDADDEYVLTLFGAGTTSAIPRTRPGHPQERITVLRTGARFTLGEWSLVFHRDESADHGAPFGGSSNAWGRHDRSQPPRPAYTRQSPAESGEEPTQHPEPL